MDKSVDFTKTVYEICLDKPDIIEIMKTLGFDSITNPSMLNTIGRIMTIPKGAYVKGIKMDTVRKEFIKNGYAVKE